jgi:hypothetical protein
LSARTAAAAVATEQGPDDSGFRGGFMARSAVPAAKAFMPVISATSTATS